MGKYIRNEMIQKWGKCLGKEGQYSRLAGLAWLAGLGWPDWLGGLAGLPGLAGLAGSIKALILDERGSNSRKLPSKFHERG